MEKVPAESPRGEEPFITNTLVRFTVASISFYGNKNDITIWVFILWAKFQVKQASRLSSLQVWSFETTWMSRTLLREDSPPNSPYSFTDAKMIFLSLTVIIFAAIGVEFERIISTLAYFVQAKVSPVRKIKLRTSQIASFHWSRALLLRRFGLF